jgi:hypothetical protein
MVVNMMMSDCSVLIDAPKLLRVGMREEGEKKRAGLQKKET